MISGHVAEALQNTPPDVYVTSDGGYNWIKVNLKIIISIAVLLEAPSPKLQSKFSTSSEMQITPSIFHSHVAIC